ncbi:MAG: sialidase family protein, partial [Candidatus Oleimicrobiaceae bacterium]
MRNRIVYGIAAIGLLIVSSLGWGQPSPSKVGATDDNYAIDYNNGPAIDRAPDGTVMAIWATGPNHGVNVLWSTYDEVFGSWNPPQVLGPGTAQRTTPALVADEYGRFHATWSKDFKIVYAQYDGTQWSAPVQVQKNDIKGNSNSIVIDSNGTIWIAWSTYRQDDNLNEWLLISHSTDNGATWSDPDTLARNMHPGVISSYFVVPHLATSRDGKVGVAYREKDLNVSSFFQIYFQEWDGNKWSDPELITDFCYSVDCYQASLCYDSRGTRHLVFYTDEVDWPTVAQGQIYYTCKADGGTWRQPVPLSADPNGIADYPAITVGPNDALYVAFLSNSYATGTGQLQVFGVTSNDQGKTWSSPFQISASPVALALRGPSIGKHPRPAVAGFSGGADVFWVQPDASEPDGNALYYGHIPWVNVSLP